MFVLGNTQSQSQPHSQPPLLELHDVCVQFGGRDGSVQAVDQVSLSVECGRTMGIAGESGSGKSMLARSVLGLTPSAATVSGRIRFDGADIGSLRRRQLEAIRGREIGLIVQDPSTSLNPTLRVGTQITEGLRQHLGMARHEARLRALELLDEVGIDRPEARLRAYPHQLSGGMQQRVVIAMALSCQPKLIIADEPTAALDVTIQAQILDLLAALRKRHGLAMLLISHDLSVIGEVADDLAIMYAGQIVEHGPASEVLTRPEHPYTEALIGALPQFEAGGGRRGRLAAIEGRPPVISGPVEGCRFAPRCPHRLRNDGCATTSSPLREIRDGHFVRSAHPHSERRTGAVK